MATRRDRKAKIISDLQSADSNLTDRKAAALAEIMLNADDTTRDIDSELGGGFDRSTSSADSLASATYSLGQAFLGLEGSSTTAFTSVLRQTEAFQSMNEIGQQAALTLAAVADRSLQLAIKTEEVQASFNKATGQMGKFNEGIADGYIRNLQFGASLEDSSDAYQNLVRHATQFTRKSVDQRAAIVDHSIILEKFGQHQGATAENFEIMTRGMGMTDEEALRTFPNMIAMASEMGMNAGDLGDQFTSNAEKFAVFGDQGVHHFRRLAAESRNTGVAMGSMLSVTEQFDTFTGAAEKVQSLNALLGATYLDTVDMMMTTDPEERFRKIRDAVESAGYTHEKIAAMGETQAYWFRQTMAKGIGVSVLEFNKMMSESGEEFTKNALNASASLEELEGATKFGRTTADQMNILKDQAAVGAAEFIKPIREVAKEAGLDMSGLIYGPMVEESVPFFRDMGETAADGLRVVKDQTIGFAVEVKDSLDDQFKQALDLLGDFQGELEKMPIYTQVVGGATAAPAAVLGAVGASPNANITVENLQLKIDGKNFMALLDDQIAKVAVEVVARLMPSP